MLVFVDCKRRDRGLPCFDGVEGEGVRREVFHEDALETELDLEVEGYMIAMFGGVCWVELIELLCDMAME